MDYQTMDQSAGQGSSNNVWYIVGVIVIIAILAIWYYTSSTSVPNVEGDTTADISAELNQIPDNSADLSQAAAASAQAVQGF